MAEIKTEESKRQNHKWLRSQVQTLLYSVMQKINGKQESFEKPTAKIFYEALHDDGCLPNIPWLVMRHKMRHLKATYMKAVNWKSNTGAGLLEEGDAKGVADYIEKICPFFPDLDQIFGGRKNVNVPVVISSTDDLEVLLNESSDVPANDSEAGIDVLTESVIETHTEEGSSGFTLDIAQPKQKKKRVDQVNPMTEILNIQNRKLELESQKFEYMKEKDKTENEMKVQMKKMEIEMEERVRKHKQELEAQIELKRMEFEMKYRNN